MNFEQLIASLISYLTERDKLLQLALSGLSLCREIASAFQTDQENRDKLHEVKAIVDKINFTY